MCRLGITNFTHHDHIRVSTQERFERFGKRPVNLGIDLNLAQAGLGDFNRVFSRPDFGALVIDETQRRVQRRGFARASGADTQHHAVGTPDCPAQFFEVTGRQANAVQRQRFGRSQQTHHHIFHTIGRGYGGHPQFQLVRGRILGKVDLAVLCTAALGNVEVAHDFDASHQRRAVGRRQLQIVFQLPVFAETHLDFAFARRAFNVNV